MNESGINVFILHLLLQRKQNDQIAQEMLPNSSDNQLANLIEEGDSFVEVKGIETVTISVQVLSTRCRSIWYG